MDREENRVFWKDKEQGQRASAKAERGVAMVWWESREITMLGCDAGGCSKVR